VDLSLDVDIAELRAYIAPAFGMRNTGKMLVNLRDAGHLLTPQSLVRIMHLHARRFLRSSVIFEVGYEK